VTLKVGDFGLARDTNQYSISSSQLPYRWTAPEIFLGQPFTTKADVYSFGVVIWEILSFGAPPFVYLSNQEVVELSIKGKLQLSKPETCTPELLSLMTECSTFQPSNRPSFSEISKRLTQLKKDK